MTRPARKRAARRHRGRGRRRSRAQPGASRGSARPSRDAPRRRPASRWTPSCSRSTRSSWSGPDAARACSARPRPRRWTGRTRRPATIELALVRQPATGDTTRVAAREPRRTRRIRLRLRARTASTTRRASGCSSSYDIVGFDPRGVGRSSAVSCYDDPAELDEYIYEIIPGRDAARTNGSRTLAASNSAFGAACLEHTGPLLQFVDTVSAARDLDLLRAVLGDSKLNFLGLLVRHVPRSHLRRALPGEDRAPRARRRARPGDERLRRDRSRRRWASRARSAPTSTDCVEREECPFTRHRSTAR